MKVNNEDFMSKFECQLMDKEIKAGRLTVFRLDWCLLCKKEIIKGKRFCSIECKIKHDQISSEEKYKLLLKKINRKKRGQE
jgi:hypothetical protein